MGCSAAERGTMKDLKKLISEMTLEEKAGICSGADFWHTKAVERLQIPDMMMSDGPHGLRKQDLEGDHLGVNDSIKAVCFPAGCAMASSFDRELLHRVGETLGKECQAENVGVILGPAVNIKRSPLCGRNFEYYSEDPMLSGRTAAATTRGLQVGGSSACPKHFACNNQEFNRNSNDSRVSVRALREIYLKNFEYCVKEGHPETMMTSYNKINGVWSHYNYDLVTTVLRKEWGYDGMIVTDWWMQKDNSHEFPALKNNAYRTRAQVDVLMPGNMSAVKRKYAFDKEQIETLGQPEGLTRAELQRSAKNVLRYCMTR